MSFREPFLSLPDGEYVMPMIGYGTWQPNTESEKEELKQCLNTALEIGYRHFDTAAMYLNEEIVGDVINEWIDSDRLKREEIYITTKLPVQNNQANSVIQALDLSLKKLRLSYVDMYLITAPFGFKPQTEFFRRSTPAFGKLDLTTDHVGLWRAMENLVHAGKVKSIGLSNFNINQISSILDIAVIRPSNLQIELHVYFQQKPLVDFCNSKGITITAFSPLGTKTVNIYGTVTGPPSSLLIDPIITTMASKYNKTPAQIALRFLLQNNFAVIPRSPSPDRMKSNFDLLEFELNEKDMDILRDMDKCEDGRIFLFDEQFPGSEKHPEYPSPEGCKRISQ